MEIIINRDFFIIPQGMYQYDMILIAPIYSLYGGGLFHFTLKDNDIYFNPIYKMQYLNLPSHINLPIKGVIGSSLGSDYNYENIEYIARSIYKKLFLRFNYIATKYETYMIQYLTFCGIYEIYKRIKCDDIRHHIFDRISSIEYRDYYHNTVQKLFNVKDMNVYNRVIIALEDVILPDNGEWINLLDYYNEIKNSR